MAFDSSHIEALNLLLLFDGASHEQGIKVHSSARPEVVAACRELCERGLVTRQDGGYLTDAGIEALGHVEVLAGLLTDRPG